jgi:hypothetical protein
LTIPGRVRHYFSGLFVFRSESNGFVPDLIPRSLSIAVSIALRHTRAILITDRSWTVHAGRDDRQEQVGPDVEAAIGDASCDRCGAWFQAKIAALET